MGTCWLQPQQRVKNLNPGHFTMVMAAGILSQAMLLDGAAALSAALLVPAIAAFLVLVALQFWRLPSYCEMVIADARDARNAFGSSPSQRLATCSPSGWPAATSPPPFRRDGHVPASADLGWPRGASDRGLVGRRHAVPDNRRGARGCAAVRYQAWLGLGAWTAVAAGMAWQAAEAAILYRHA
jgi:hypothetical protein